MPILYINKYFTYTSKQVEDSSLNSRRAVHVKGSRRAAEGCRRPAEGSKRAVQSLRGTLRGAVEGSSGAVQLEGSR